MGVHAVLAAMAAAPQADRSGHAVVAAPCQAGRLAAARTLALLSSGGAVTVSPHIVPQCSLHSIAGAVSVALGMHGPHLGVGGGPDALAEGLFAAATLVGSVGSACPAAWLVVTDWDEEPDLDETGESRGDPVCRALALLLLPGGSPDGGGEELPSISLAVRLPHEPPASSPAQATPGGLLAFARGLEICAAGAALAAWTVTSRWGGEIRLSRQPAGIRLREAA